MANYNKLARFLGFASLGLGLVELLAPHKVQQLVNVRGDHQGLIRILGARELVHALLIFMQRQPSPGVWSRVAGDTIDLALLGAVVTAARAEQNTPSKRAKRAISRAAGKVGDFFGQAADTAGMVTSTVTGTAAHVADSVMPHQSSIDKATKTVKQAAGDTIDAVAEAMPTRKEARAAAHDAQQAAIDARKSAAKSAIGAWAAASGFAADLVTGAMGRPGFIRDGNGNGKAAAKAAAKAGTKATATASKAAHRAADMAGDYVDQIDTKAARKAAVKATNRASKAAGDTMSLAADRFSSLYDSAAEVMSRPEVRLATVAAALLGITALDVFAATQLTRERMRQQKFEPTYGDLTQEQLSGRIKDGRFKVTESVTINRSPSELYTFWRNFENLPQFMYHLQSVQVLDGSRSHWVTKAPAGTHVEWDAEIVEDVPNELIAWRSVEGADVPNSGLVTFHTATAGRGTVVHVEIEYMPPAGAFGKLVAKLFGEDAGQQVRGDLMRFKQVMETGEVVYSDGTPSGFGQKHQRPARPE